MYACLSVCLSVCLFRCVVWNLQLGLVPASPLFLFITVSVAPTTSKFCQFYRRTKCMKISVYHPQYGPTAKVAGLSSTKPCHRRQSRKLNRCNSSQLFDAKGRVLSKPEKTRIKFKSSTRSCIANTFLVDVVSDSPYPCVGSKHACAATHRSQPACKRIKKSECLVSENV